MARTSKKLACRADYQKAKSGIERELESGGYSLKDYHGEQVWKKGVGLATAMQYIKVEYGENEITLFGWIQVGVGDLGGKEMDLNGFVGIIPKKAVKKQIDKLEKVIAAF